MKIVHTKQVQETGTSHDPTIKKKVFINNSELPYLTQFGSATFKPNQSVETHVHPSMHEVFLIQKGKINFLINGKVHILNSGDCITIHAGEPHSQHNPYSEDSQWIYFGIAIDSK